MHSPFEIILLKCFASREYIFYKKMHVEEIKFITNIRFDPITLWEVQTPQPVPFPM
jgi:hypothetical protein